MRGYSERPDWREGKRRYIVHFSNGSAGMRFFDEPLEVGALVESGTYRVERVEQASYPDGLSALQRLGVCPWQPPVRVGADYPMARPPSAPSHKSWMPVMSWLVTAEPLRLARPIVVIGCAGGHHSPQ
jgi:hypothetical protein